MMTPMPTPSKRSLARPRPSLKTAIQPPASPQPQPLGSPLLSPSSMLARKASFQQLTQNSLASVPDGSAEYGLTSPKRGRQDYGMGKKSMGGDIEVGDVVDTPGGLHGVVKFIGAVRGKGGLFLGVELEGVLSGRGKNDGTVDGVRYFTTASPMSGIFVPVSRATKRLSATSTNPPPTPPLSGFAGRLSPSKRSESPGPRAIPSFGRNTGRPSLSRPESPVRRMPSGRPSLLPPGTPRHASAAGGNRLLAPSPTPGRLFSPVGGRSRAVSVSNSPERPPTSGGPPRITPVPKQMGARLEVKKPNSMANRNGNATERRVPDEEPTFSPSAETLTPASAIGIANGGEETETHNGVDNSPKNVESAVTNKETNNGIDTELDNRTKEDLITELRESREKLNEQTNSLLEMEFALTELQSLIGTAQTQAQNSMSPILASPNRNLEDADASQLRALLREKNDRIQILTAEFDSHRADFRSTIDTLELASTETVRVYEKRIDDLMIEIRELHERSEDVESVARQLKQLEELVAELEEGLEDARRGEAEARGEVEFLRGEVERSKEELRREKEKSAAAVANAAVGNMMRNNTAEELEKKDEEIRGLKAIIHSLSQDHISDDEGSNSRRSNGLERSQSVPNGNVRRPDKSVTNEEMEDRLEKERRTREAIEDRVKELEEELELQRENERQREIEREHELEQRKPETSLEDRIKELEIQLRLKTERETQLEREIELMERDRRNSVLSEKAPPKTNPVISAITEKTFNEVTRPSISESIIEISTESKKDDSNVRDSGSVAGSVASWISARAESTTHHGAAEDTDDEDAEALWCEICETGGHDILTCTSMFGSSADAHKPALTHDDEDARMGTAVSTPIDMDREIAPLSIKMASPLEQGADEPMTSSESSTGTTRKKSVHLPLPPPMVDGNVAGKESGIIDDSKWCALCERDGHDSVDCPFDDDSY